MARTRTTIARGRDYIYRSIIQRVLWVVNFADVRFRVHSGHKAQNKSSPKDRPILEQKGRPSFLGRPKSMLVG
jgi:hypothetical protein